MNSKNLKKDFMNYVSLNIIAMIGLSGYILADTFYISLGIGINGLAALNLAIPVYSFINGTGLMIGIGGATSYAISKAQQEHQKANQMFTHALLFGAVTGFVFCLIGIFCSEYLCRLLGSNEEILHPTNTYLKTLMMFAPAFMINNVLVAFVRNDGAPNLSMAAMLTGSISNIILDYVFIFPCRMGIFGAAFATGLAPVLSMMVLSIHMLKKKNQFHLFWDSQWLPIHWAFLGTICSLGSASMITELASGIVMILFNFVILGLNGNPGIAAYGIVANLALVATSLFTGISQGIQPLISTCYGLGRKTDIKKLGNWANMLAVTIAALVCVVVFFGASPLAAIFNSEHNTVVAKLAVQGLHLYFFGFLFAGYNIVQASILSSVEQPALAFVISLLRGCVVIVPCLFLLANIGGMNGVWLSFPVTELITCITVILLQIWGRTAAK